MTRMRVEIQSVYCGRPEYTEDVTGADEFYLTGAVTDGKTTSAVLTRPISINDGETKNFTIGGGTVFNADVPNDAILKVGLIAFDEDAAKDWNRRQEIINRITTTVSGGLAATGNPYAVGAAAVLPFVKDAIGVFVNLDEDDELGTHLQEWPAWLTPDGTHTASMYCTKVGSSYSNWRYRIFYRMIKG